MIHYPVVGFLEAAGKLDIGAKWSEEYATACVFSGRVSNVVQHTGPRLVHLRSQSAALQIDPAEWETTHL